jgi:Subtilase family
MKTLWRFCLGLLPGLILSAICILLLQTERVEAAPTAQVKKRPPVYMRNQIIAMGTLSDLAKVEVFYGTQFNLRTMRQTSASYFTRLTPAIRDQQLPPGFVPRSTFFVPSEWPKLSTNVIAIGSSATPDQVIAIIRANSAFSRVLVSRDYIVANDWGIIADPKWGGKGSGYVTSTLAATPTLYTQQFAQLSAFGMGPLSGSPRPYPFSGKNANIVLLDTSPFSVTTGTTALRDYYGIPVSVTHPALTDIPTNVITSPLYIPGHGLFAAGLAHAIAPDANLAMYRVLNDQGLGTESDVFSALNTYSNTFGGNTVMNLSFSMMNGDDTIPITDPLAVTLNVIAGLGTTVVAAAGNDSDTGPAKEMNFPASNSYVLGTAAANAQGKRACYSNTATFSGTKKGVGAPGGEGDMSDGTCQPPTNYVCINDPLCLVTSWWHPSLPPSMTFGAGTSFAAPFASGTAALAIERFNVLSETISIYKVPQWIISYTRLTDPQLGYGIINLGDMFLPRRTYLPIATKQ